MKLPHSEKLPINKLAAIFGSTSATYKYYWFIALIELIEEKNIQIPKRKIFARMISKCWYTINYFHVSFGQQDNLQQAVKIILQTENLTIDAKQLEIETILQHSSNKATIQQLVHFDKNVPHWFLSPWFPKKSKNEIYKLSQSFENHSLYALYNDYIQIHPEWLVYLQSNAKFLKDFAYWNLALFLQARNPSVPDIPNKLIKPAVRNGLAKQTNEYWKLVFQELGTINCIFTGTKFSFQEKNFAIDHFIPYAFVSHDLIWNLLPIEKKFNTSKSDKLPIFDLHFHKFYELQKIAYEINIKHNAKSKYMEEFLSIFPSDDAFEKSKLANTIQPLITIANNNGFLFMNE